MMLAGFLVAGAFVVAEPDVPTYTWHTAVPGEIVQYGIPDSDDRALRIDCREGRLLVLGPSPLDAAEGTPVDAAFVSGPGIERFEGRIVWMGDGNNFEVAVADAHALAGLIDGETMTILHGGAQWEVPGAGAASEIAPLIAACRR